MVDTLVQIRKERVVIKKEVAVIVASRWEKNSRMRILREHEGQSDRDVLSSRLDLPAIILAYLIRRFSS